MNAIRDILQHEGGTCCSWTALFICIAFYFFTDARKLVYVRQMNGMVLQFCKMKQRELIEVIGTLEQPKANVCL